MRKQCTKDVPELPHHQHDGSGAYFEDLHNLYSVQLPDLIGSVFLITLPSSISLHTVALEMSPTKTAEIAKLSIDLLVRPPFRACRHEPHDTGERSQQRFPEPLYGHRLGGFTRGLAGYFLTFRRFNFLLPCGTFDGPPAKRKPTMR